MKFLFSYFLCNLSCFFSPFIIFSPLLLLHNLIMVKAKRRVVIDAVFFEKPCFPVFHLYDIDGTIIRHVPLPEIIRVFIKLPEKCPHGASVSGNQNGFVCFLRIIYQFVEKLSRSFTHLRDTFSVRGTFKMKWVYEKSIIML